MSDKLLTLRELSEYLHVSEEKIISLVDKKVLSAYKIGGELLRFRKDQIDAIKTEIDFQLKSGDKAKIETKPVERGYRPTAAGFSIGNFFDPDNLSDFLYFNDFYLVAGALVVLLLIIIFRG